MTSERFLLEVDTKFIEDLFNMAGISTPSNVKVDQLNYALERIKEKISPNDTDSKKNSQVNEYMLGGVTTRPKTVLIVDDLGIITYQLEVLFKKMGFEVAISQEVYDAIEKYKKQDFGYAVIDLFIPTEREGFILLDELKKLSLLCKLNTRIIVMTASSKPEYEAKCLNRGADFYIEKSPGWQKKIIEASVGA